MSIANNRHVTADWSRALLGDMDITILDRIKTADMLIDYISKEIKGNGKKANEILNSQGDPYAYTRQEGRDFEFYKTREGFLTTAYVQYYELNKILSQELLEYMRNSELKSFLESKAGASLTKQMTGMALAMKQTMNKTFCEFLSNYQSSTQTFGDGTALASATQPLIFGGTFSNLRNAAPPDPEIIQNLIIDQSAWLGHSGRTVRVMPRCVVGGENLRFLFEQMITCEGDIETNKNKRNMIAVKQGTYLPEGYHTDPEYPNDGSWFIVNDIMEGEGLVSFIHKKFESDVRQHPFSWDTMIVSQAAWVHSVGLKHCTHWVAGT
jgi:hypothetical protein